MSQATKAILKLVFRLLAIPIRIVARLFKAALRQLFPGTAQNLDAVLGWAGDKKRAALDSMKAAFGDKPPPDGKNTDEVLERTTEVFAASQDTSDLVARSEAKSEAWDKCKLCTIRFKFQFKLHASECFLGFSPHKYRLKVGTMPLTGGGILKVRHTPHTSVRCCLPPGHPPPPTPRLTFHAADTV